MNHPTSIKPEPIKAKSSWSYQEYFLSQLQRRKATNAQIPSITIYPTESNCQLEAEERNRVIARMEELAASIGVQITIISNSSAA